MIVDAVIVSVVRIKGEEAAGVAPGMMRFYVNAEVQTLIRGSSGIPKKVGYLVDVPVDSLGKTTKLKHLRVLLFARPRSEERRVGKECVRTSRSRRSPYN